MDEPFGALDPVTRAALQAEIARIHQLSGRTIVLVTHDIDEALGLADRLVLLDQGRVVQQGTPLALLTAPANDFVRDFFGRSDRGIKLLSLGTVAERVRPGAAEGEPIAAAMSLREALSVFGRAATACRWWMNGAKRWGVALQRSDRRTGAVMSGRVWRLLRDPLLGRWRCCWRWCSAWIICAACSPLVPRSGAAHLSAGQLYRAGGGAPVAGGDLQPDRGGSRRGGRRGRDPAQRPGVSFAGGNGGGGGQTFRRWRCWR